VYAVETYAAVRRFVIVEGNSQREASRVFGISRTTVYKMCTYSAPPGYQRTKPSAKPKLDQFIAIIYEILKADAGAPKKQRQSGLGVKSRTADCEACSPSASLRQFGTNRKWRILRSS
jgi:transposase